MSLFSRAFRRRHAVFFSLWLACEGEVPLKEGSFESGISFADNSSLCLISFLFCAGAGEMYYYVVLNGFHITEQKITSYTKNDKVCWPSATLSAIVDDPSALRSTFEITCLFQHLRSLSTSAIWGERQTRLVGGDVGFLVVEAHLNAEANVKIGHNRAFTWVLR